MIDRKIKRCKACTIEASGSISHVKYEHKCGRSESKKYVIPKKSAKRLIEEKEYMEVRKEVLNESLKRCQIRVFGVCTTTAKDVHHKGKRGKNYLDKTLMVAVCRECHNWIHENPGKARELGYLITA
jgi:hypothetical protein